MLEGLRKNVAKASMTITFQVYLGMMVFASCLTFIIVFALSLLILTIGLPLAGAFILSFVTALMAFLISIGVAFSYPLLAMSSKTRKIDANLSFTANFMSVLASSGMPPERIFQSLAKVGDEFGVGGEMRRAIGDIELLGLDLNGALKAAAMRSSSKKFGALLDGVVTTAHMGGDLASYLRDEADKFKKVRMTSMKAFLDSLAGMAEVYVSFMVALPLAL